MKNKNWAVAFLAAWILIPATIFAHEYAPGTHQWKVRGGTVYVVSGLLTNNAALYAHNYNFYFQREGEKSWHQVPLIDQGKPGEYELNITTKAKEERMVRDARIEIRGKDVYLLRARSTRENDFNDSPITVTKYRLVSTEGDDWPYFFERVSGKTYPPSGDNGIDAAIKQEAKNIK